MSEDQGQVMCVSQSADIGTDIRVPMPSALARYLRGPYACDTESVQSGDWDMVYSRTECTIEATIDRLGAEPHPSLVIEEKWSYSVLPKIRKAETTCMYKGAVVRVREGLKIISIHDVAGSEVCISSDSGQKVYDTLRSAISQGNKVQISFENIKSISAAFLDSAIGQLYNGKIQVNVDENLSFESISPGRLLMVKKAISDAKEYYSNPEGYIAKMKKIFADD